MYMLRKVQSQFRKKVPCSLPNPKILYSPQRNHIPQKQLKKKTQVDKLHAVLGKCTIPREHVMIVPELPPREYM